MRFEDRHPILYTFGQMALYSGTAFIVVCVIVVILGVVL